MSILLVASPAPRVGRSLVAAALAYRAARDGRQVTLARLTGDESADHDARVFSEIAELSAPSAPLAAQDLSSLTSDAIVEAPAGPIGA